MASLKCGSTASPEFAKQSDQRRAHRKLPNRCGLDIFRERLREQLQAAAEADPDLTQAEVARRAGISPRRLNNYLQTPREPSYEVLVELCKVLKTHPNYLLGCSCAPQLSLSDDRLDRLERKLDSLVQNRNE